MTIETDAVKALAIYGDASLCNVKGFLAKHGFVLPEHGKEARLWCERQAGTGDIEACYVAAEMLRWGLFGPTDRNRALELCRTATAAAYPPAILLQASMVERDNERSARLLMEEAAKKGYAAAMYATALKYIVDGVDQAEKELGLRYLRLAATHGYAPAQTTLATHLLEVGGEDNLRQGIELMQEAAYQGSSHAKRMLAHYFETGRYGLRADANKARELRAKADRAEAEVLATWGLDS